MVSQQEHNKSVQQWAPFACVVMGVAGSSISSHNELGRALQRNTDESVVLHVLRVALPTLRLVCSRTSRDDGSLPSWGLRIAPNLNVESVDQGSPIGRMLLGFLQQLPEDGDDGLRTVLQSCCQSLSGSTEETGTVRHQHQAKHAHSDDGEVDDDDMDSLTSKEARVPNSTLQMATALGCGMLRVHALRIASSADGYDTDVIEDVSDHVSLASKMRRALRIDLVLQVVVPMG